MRRRAAALALVGLTALSVAGCAGTANTAGTATGAGRPGAAESPVATSTPTAAALPQAQFLPPVSDPASYQQCLDMRSDWFAATSAFQDGIDAITTASPAEGYAQMLSARDSITAVAAGLPDGEIKTQAQVEVGYYGTMIDGWAPLADASSMQSLTTDQADQLAANFDALVNAQSNADVGLTGLCGNAWDIG